MPKPPSRFVLPFGLLLGLLLVVPARAGEWSLDALRASSSWEGFGVGTQVHYKTVTTIRAEGRDDLNRTIEKETKATLVEVADDALVIRVEELAEGAWKKRSVRHPRTSGSSSGEAAIEDLGRERLEIGGATYACVKQRLPDVSDLLDGPPEPGEARNPAEHMPGVVWLHPERGVLKVESTVRVADTTATSTLVVSRLDVPHRVGTTDLSCRELTWSSSRVGGKTVRLESPAVPGRTVLTTGEVEQGPVHMTHRRELVAVRVVPVTPAGGG